ncbi:hypothetical protein LC087_15010 [Bacillus carboniphilus]|uniref:Uncharacterized protein n=1 Tax=Bacillus carboniphilus TaxID=86663 RepID=A0ABY9JRM9_9BACI|nr:hypothetical protein [Bacillus carboniphilus]WLR42064.1 hypothetical protein LC087_15010 [Bacillus carboniphilus]
MNMKKYLECGCIYGKTTSLRIEVDVADPIWCDKCSYNLEMEELPLSNQLTSEINDWVALYEQSVDWESDSQMWFDDKLAEKINQKGIEITKRVKKELAVTPFLVTYKPV